MVCWTLDCRVRSWRNWLLMHGAGVSRQIHISSWTCFRYSFSFPLGILENYSRCIWNIMCFMHLKLWSSLFVVQPVIYMSFMEREAGYYNEPSVTYLSIMEYQLKNALVRTIKYDKFIKTYLGSICRHLNLLLKWEMVGQALNLGNQSKLNTMQMYLNPLPMLWGAYILQFEL